MAARPANDDIYAPDRLSKAEVDPDLGPAPLPETGGARGPQADCESPKVICVEARAVGAEGWRIPGLKTRGELVREEPGGADLSARIAASVGKGAPVLFHPTDCETVSYADKVSQPGDWVYSEDLHLYGILTNGARAHVVVHDVPCYFDVETPEDYAEDPGRFAEILSRRVERVAEQGGLRGFNSSIKLKLFAAAGAAEDFAPLAYVHAEVVWLKPCLRYVAAARPFVRLRFANRKIADAAVGWAKSEGYATSSDDLRNADFACKVAREQGVPLADWLVLRDYAADYGSKPPPAGERAIVRAQGQGGGGGRPGRFGGGGPGGRREESAHSEYVFYVRAGDPRDVRTNPAAIPHRRPRGIGLEPLVPPLGPDGTGGADPDADAEAAAAAERAEALRNSNPSLYQDKTLVCGWDLECHTDRGLGTLPSAERPGDEMFMGCFVFSWAHEPDRPLLQVNVVTMPCAPDPRWTTVYVRNGSAREREGAAGRAIGAVLSALAPDVLTDFNGFGFDHPYLVGVLGKNRDLGAFYDRVRGRVPDFPPGPTADRDVLHPNYGKYKHISVKITPDHSEKGHRLRWPGTLPIDSRIMMMKEAPKHKPKSLRSFLGMCGLPAKVDMPIGRLFEVATDARAVRDEAEAIADAALALVANIAAENAAPADRVRAENTADRVRAENTADRVRAENTADRVRAAFAWGYPGPGAAAALRALGSPDARALADALDADCRGMTLGDRVVACANAMRAVGFYCVVDSLSCSRLLAARDVIPYRRSVATLSYTTQYDALYKADGQKVMNMIAGFALRPEYSYACPVTTRGEPLGDKFEGAFVFPPKRGLNPDPSDPYARAFGFARAGAAGVLARAALAGGPGFAEAALAAAAPLVARWGAGQDARIAAEAADEFAARHPHITEFSTPWGPACVGGAPAAGFAAWGDGLLDFSPDLLAETADWAARAAEADEEEGVEHPLYSHGRTAALATYAAGRGGKAPAFPSIGPGSDVAADRRRDLAPAELVHSSLQGVVDAAAGSAESASAESEPASSTPDLAKVAEELARAFLLYRRMAGVFFYVTGREMTGLDFSSLYPSIIAAYDLSPDRYIGTRAELAEFYAANPGAREAGSRAVHHVKFDLGGGTHEAWYVRRLAPGGPPMGMFGVLLLLLKEVRNGIKAQMKPFKMFIEFLDTSDGKPTPEAGRAYLEEERAKLAAKGGARNEIIVGLLDRVLAGGRAAVEVEARAKFNNLNSKQKAVKVLMNTVYGTAGDARSWIFQLTLAGGVTQMGQANIKLVSRLVNERGFITKYGDTDSVYPQAPPHLHAEADAGFFVMGTGRLAWMTAIVETAMEALTVLRDYVNGVLEADNGTINLKVAYEEVLFPNGLTSKKKYYGAEHEEEINFFPGKRKKVFIRGLEVIKQSVTPFAADVGWDAIWSLLDIYNVRSPLACATAALSGAIVEAETRWGVAAFAKSIPYRPDKQNTTALTFVARAKAAVAAGEPGWEVPKAGERFDSVVAFMGDAVDLRGNAVDWKVGQKMFPLAAFRARGMTLDFEYYFTRSVIGILSRFCCASPRFIEAALAAGVDPGVYKALDEATNKLAKKHLLAVSKRTVAAIVDGGGGVDSALRPQYRDAFKAAARRAAGSLAARGGDRAVAALIFGGKDSELIPAEQFSEVAAAGYENFLVPEAAAEAAAGLGKAAEAAGRAAARRSGSFERGVAEAIAAAAAKKGLAALQETFRICDPNQALKGGSAFSKRYSKAFTAQLREAKLGLFAAATSPAAGEAAARYESRLFALVALERRRRRLDDSSAGPAAAEAAAETAAAASAALTFPEHELAAVAEIEAAYRRVVAAARAQEGFRLQVEELDAARRRPRGSRAAPIMSPAAARAAAAEVAAGARARR